MLSPPTLCCQVVAILAAGAALPFEVAAYKTDLPELQVRKHMCYADRCEDATRIHHCWQIKGAGGHALQRNKLFAYSFDISQYLFSLRRCSAIQWSLKSETSWPALFQITSCCCIQRLGSSLHVTVFSIFALACAQHQQCNLQEPLCTAQNKLNTTFNSPEGMTWIYEWPGTIDCLIG